MKLPDGLRFVSGYGIGTRDVYSARFEVGGNLISDMIRREDHVNRLIVRVCAFTGRAYAEVREAMMAYAEPKARTHPGTVEMYCAEWVQLVIDGKEPCAE